MDSFELNKILGAILGTLLFVMGVGFLAEAIYHPVVGNGPGYALPEPEPTQGGEGGGADTPAVSIATLLASADPVAGADQAKKCQACHDFSEANTNKTGPGLYDTVERVIGSHPGFAYSAVMQEHAAAGDKWTYDNLNAFLMSPKGFAPGTKMTFAGVKNDQERANIIAYMSTLSASPVPFPAAEPEVDGVPTDEQLVDGTESAPADVVETPAGSNTSTTDAPTATTDTPPAGGAGAEQADPPAASAESPAVSADPAAPADASSAAQ